jgi:Uma2 family endonuclease
MSTATGVSTVVVPSSPLSPDSDLVTVEEFYCLVPDGQKADLIDGVIYMASPDTRRSDRLSGFIKFLMQGYAAVQGLGMVGGPDIAVEIVSRESRQRDYGEKKQLYADAGVSEYWIIDPLQRRVEFHRLRAGRYEPVPLAQNRIFRSTVLEGFWLDVEWLLAEPLPNEYQKLQEILAQQERVV